MSMCSESIGPDTAQVEDFCGDCMAPDVPRTYLLARTAPASAPYSLKSARWGQHMIPDFFIFTTRWLSGSWIAQCVTTSVIWESKALRGRVAAQTTAIRKNHTTGHLGSCPELTAELVRVTIGANRAGRRRNRRPEHDETARCRCSDSDSDTSYRNTCQSTAIGASTCQRTKAERRQKPTISMAPSRIGVTCSI